MSLTSQPMLCSRVVASEAGFTEGRNYAVASLDASIQVKIKVGPSFGRLVISNPGQQQTLQTCEKASFLSRDP